MGSGAECVHETVEHLVAQGERVGVIKVRLFRPFAIERLLQVLPASVQALAVLDDRSRRIVEERWLKVNDDN